MAASYDARVRCAVILRPNFGQPAGQCSAVRAVTVPHEISPRAGGGGRLQGRLEGRDEASSHGPGRWRDLRRGHRHRLPAEPHELDRLDVLRPRRCDVHHRYVGRLPPGGRCMDRREVLHRWRVNVHRWDLGGLPSSRFDLDRQSVLHEDRGHVRRGNRARLPERRRQVDGREVLRRRCRRGVRRWQRAGLCVERPDLDR